ncbi:hypothetical protein Y032_0242g3427 [Ancylostoma ceylanicum]|uniref:Uncharacterized protein n=1 Tax=Ancylostoma ceylanicum TaxID=53326 RepID=A0A016SEE0_9BILA|nr:hypothetical protein Y032_0242g3427 [Ancylostoma ceylanicum]
MVFFLNFQLIRAGIHETLTTHSTMGLLGYAFMNPSPDISCDSRSPLKTTHDDTSRMATTTKYPYLVNFERLMNNVMPVLSIFSLIELAPFSNFPTEISSGSKGGMVAV